eukprot:354314-Chlamydomonas_euryale.AAC.30
MLCLRGVGGGARCAGCMLTADGCCCCGFAALVSVRDELGNGAGGRTRGKGQREYGKAVFERAEGFGGRGRAARQVF